MDGGDIVSLCGGLDNSGVPSQTYDSIPLSLPLIDA